MKPSYKAVQRLREKQYKKQERLCMGMLGTALAGVVYGTWGLSVNISLGTVFISWASAAFYFLYFFYKETHERYKHFDNLVSESNRKRSREFFERKYPRKIATTNFLDRTAFKKAQKLKNIRSKRI